MAEHEDLSQVVFPKQKYVKSVRLGLRFYGTAPNEEEQEQQIPPEEVQGEASSAPQRVAGVTADIWFEGAGQTWTKEFQSSLARLRANMGHPPEEELIRILAASNALSSKVLTGIKTMRRGSCLCLSLPKKPPVSSTSTSAVSQFGHRTQANIVDIRTLIKNVPVLGLLDDFASYQVARTLTETVLEMMQQMWYHPLGLPRHVTVDPGAAFLREAQQWPQGRGIEYDIIPAEEHWRIGKVERRNTLWRSLVERLVDRRAINAKEALDSAITPSTFSFNGSMDVCLSRQCSGGSLVLWTICCQMRRPSGSPAVPRTNNSDQNFSEQKR